MSNGARIFINLIIVSADKSLIAKEVDGLVFDTRDVLLGFNVLQAVSLVPASGEDIERDLTTDGVAILTSRVSIISKGKFRRTKPT